MARYDKYDPIAGGTRAKLNAALTFDGNGEFGPKAVSLNASGRVVVGTGGQSGIIGVLVKNAAKQSIGQFGTTPFNGTANAYAPVGAQAGDVVDIMQHGDIVGLDTTAFPAGSKVFAATDGTLSVTSGTGKFHIGWTVEAGRLLVRVGSALIAVP